MTFQTEVPLLPFSTQKKWRSWLTKNYDKVDGIWMLLYKKDSGVKSITYDEALEEALCFGWIDGLRKKYDDKSYIQKFTPRRKRSIWSKRNRAKAEKLIKEGKIHKAGLVEIKKAKQDGRWEKAYDSHTTMKIPNDFLEELSKYPKALAFFKSLNKTNLYSIGFRLQTARKPETRRKRMQLIIEMMKQGKKFH